jgi:hypothetical protein
MAGKPRLTQQHNPLEYLTSRYRSPSALFVIDLVVVLTGLGSVSAASMPLSGSFSPWDAKGSSRGCFPAFPARFRDDFRFCRHLFIPATIVVFLLFPLWGILRRGRTPDGPAAVRGAGMALTGRYRGQLPAESPAQG